MKTILMIGDSWGVPDYTINHHDSHPQYHIQNLLIHAGYKVYNCSINSGSNLHTINLAEDFLNGELCQLEPKMNYTKNFKLFEIIVTKMSNLQRIDVDATIDYVIWFHTEFFREVLVDHQKTYQDNVDFISHEVYRRFSELIKKLNCKTIVLGGQAPVHTDVLLQYLKPDLLIKDWKSDILRGNSEFIEVKLADGTYYKSKYLPELHSYGVHDRFNSPADTIENKSFLLKNLHIIQKALSDSPMFPDNCHPAKEAHSNLFKIINKFISGDYI